MRAILKEAAEKLKILLDDEAVARFDKYTELLLEYNKVMNLTAITDKKEIEIKHFLDSLSLLSVTDIKKGASVADLGSGAGFPGMPVKIARGDLSITFMDSLKKRVDFLSTVIKALGLKEAESIHVRAEEAGQDERFRERFDLVTSRAVADLSVLSEYCLPLVREGGFFAAMKGPLPESEIEAAKKAIDLLGGRIDSVKKIILPGNITHSIILIEKTGQTPPKYPRSSGKPSKSPIK